MRLELEESHSKRRGLYFRVVKTLKLPLYFDGNSSCIHVGERNRDISELDLGLPPQPQDFWDMATDDSSEQDSTEQDSTEQDSDSGLD